MELNGKKVEKVLYFWFDHCFLRGTGIEKHIEKAIEKHDWVQFKTYQEILNNMVTKGQNNKKWEYLPNHVHIKYKNGDCERVKLTKDLFDKIEDSEYECG